MQMRKRRVEAEDVDREKYVAALKSAQQEYDVARSCFGEAVEADIIDESIFLMEAARRKYSYFLRRVRNASTTR
jgi:hypothetical protein